MRTSPSKRLPYARKSCCKKGTVFCGLLRYNQGQRLQGRVLCLNDELCTRDVVATIDSLFLCFASSLVLKANLVRRFRKVLFRFRFGSTILLLCSCSSRVACTCTGNVSDGTTCSFMPALLTFFLPWSFRTAHLDRALSPVRASYHASRFPCRTWGCLSFSSLVRPSLS